MRTPAVTLIILALLTAGEARAQDKAANAAKAEAPLKVTVESVKGVAHKRNTADPEGKWEAIKVGDVLGERCLARTGLGSEVVLKLAGRGTATVRSSTKIGIGQFRRRGKGIQAKLGLKYGSINTTVDKTQGPHDVKLTTAVATMSLRGTNNDTSFNGDTGYSNQCNSGKSDTTCDLGSSQGTRGGQGTDGGTILPGELAKDLGDVQLGDTAGGQTLQERRALNRNGGGSGIFRNAAASLGGRAGLLRRVRRLRRWWRCLHP